MKKVITILLILSMLTIPCNAKLYAENSNKTLVKMEISHIQGDKNINNEVSPVGTDSLESMPEDNEDVLPIDIEAMEHTMIEPIKITVNQAVYMDDILYGNSVYYNVLKKAGKQDILKNIDVKNVPPYKAETDNKVQESQPEEPINNNDSTENEVINQTLINNSEEDSIEQTKDDTDLKAEISLEISNNDDRASNLDNNYDKASVTDAVYDENKENSAYTESETTFEQKESDLLGINSELMQTMSTTSSNKAYYNTLVGPSAMNNVHNEKYSTWSEMGEIISPETGDLTYQETDLKLPGRNGLDLDIGRIYQSNQALWGDRKCSADLNIGYTDYSTYYLNRYALGLGWSFKFPSVQVEKDEGQTELYYHTGAGPVYHVEFTADTSDSNLEDYDKKDAVFDNDTSYSNGQVSSQYVFKTADQTKQYFAADGRLLAIADRFNNRILFQHIERPVTNYAPNYSFYYPENKGIWTTNSYYSYDQNIGMESSSSGKSLKFSSVASVTVSSMSKYIEVLPNTKYYLGGYINDQLTQGNCSLAYREYNNNYVETQGSAYAPASKNSWQLCEGYFTTGSSAKYIRIEFKNQTAIGSSWFDTVRFDRAWPLISNINDSIGRNISFTYTDNLYAINPSSGQIHITVNDPANTSNFSFDYTRGLYYCDHNYFTNGVSQWSEERRYPCLSNFNDGNRYHGYSYFIDQDPMEKFSFISKNLNGDYAYAPRSLLSGVYLTRSAIHYDWQKTTKHLGASGAYETYRVNNRYEQNLFTGGYQGTNYHRQYTYSGNYNGTDYDNETGYPGSYSLGDNANFLFTSTLQQDNNLIVKQTFKGGKEYKTETINSDGQKDILYNEVYDTAFKKQPTKVKNEKISASGTWGFPDKTDSP